MASYKIDPQLTDQLKNLLFDGVAPPPDVAVVADDAYGNSVVADVPGIVVDSDVADVVGDLSDPENLVASVPDGHLVA